MMNHLFFCFLDVYDKATTLNYNILNQNLETQLTRHDSIQYLEVEENKEDDANCKKSEKEAHFMSEKSEKM